jgi:hypothetical protein
MTPDAFFQACNEPRATRECLRSYRAHFPTSYVYLVSDGGADLSGIAREFSCEYEHLPRIGPCPLDLERSREWLRRFAHAARRGAASHMLLLEDDVLIRGPIERPDDFHIAGPWHERARLTPALFEYLHAKHPHIVSDRYGGCGGSMFRRETLIECIEAADFTDPALNGTLEHRLPWYDLMVTVLFLVRGYPYTSLEDVYCEASDLYPDWETNGRPIVHQYKPWYGVKV